MNSFLSGFLNPLSCHALFAEKVHPSRDALIRCGTTSWANAANLVTLPCGWPFLLEQDTGVEPAFTAWEAVVLPIYESCIVWVL